MQHLDRDSMFSSGHGMYGNCRKDIGVVFKGTLSLIDSQLDHLSLRAKACRLKIQNKEARVPYKDKHLVEAEKMDQRERKRERKREKEKIAQ